MRYLLLFLLPFTAILLQSTVFSFYSIKGTLPDLVLVFVVFFALINGARGGTIYGFLCGLFEDLYLGRFIGVNALSKALTAYLVGHFQDRVFKENILVALVTVMLGTIINSLVVFFLALFTHDIFNVDMSIAVTVLYQCIYNTVLALPLYLWYYNSSYKGVLRPTEER
ncbi:MAG: rod shape-determining protein MreD [Syntrophomonas sp.]|uniref:rod shape-determining protein MreD n=1 Tax=Syntrophomonas sp. TaxID=2053627 RepID=UPI00262F010A|nr:rod shape-determining protein MreD [Syntrophomonas sp.]MDD2510175.1 rod shape-determining protein MreD [Syntrophomonas sp.]MDD4625782.1 rod shape-determining protein MreD [Syntrophomonas sp.]